MATSDDGVRWKSLRDQLAEKAVETGVKVLVGAAVCAIIGLVVGGPREAAESISKSVGCKKS